MLWPELRLTWGSAGEEAGKVASVFEHMGQVSPSQCAG